MVADGDSGSLAACPHQHFGALILSSVGPGSGTPRI